MIREDTTLGRFSNIAKICASPLIVVFTGCSTLSTENIDLGDTYGNITPGGPYDPASRYYVLSKTLLSIEVRGSGEDIFIADPTAVSVTDARYAFQIRTHLSAFSSDQYVIDLNNDGTLNKIKTTATDKMGEVIKTVGSFIVTLLTGVPSTVDTTTRALFDKDAPILLRLSFDPSSPADVVRINQTLIRRGFPLRIEACSLGWEPSLGDNSRPLACDPAPEDDRSVAGGEWTPPQDGVIYRPALPWRMTVMQLPSDVVQSQHIVSIPNKSPLLSIPLDRTAFVNRVNEITFANGIPTKIDINKPSEALAFVSIPLEILNGVLSAISQIIPLAGKSAIAENTLLQQQKLIYDNRLALEKAKAAYEASRRGIAPGESNQTVGPDTQPRVGE
jgi:hypothetical protein